jgi:hypothetical protein
MSRGARQEDGSEAQSVKRTRAKPADSTSPVAPRSGFCPSCRGEMRLGPWAYRVFAPSAVGTILWRSSVRKLPSRPREAWLASLPMPLGAPWMPGCGTNRSTELRFGDGGSHTKKSRQLKTEGGSADVGQV